MNATDRHPTRDAGGAAAAQRRRTDRHGSAGGADGHRRVSELFEEFERTHSTSRRRELVQQISSRVENAHMQRRATDMARRRRADGA